jgi:hypothetical protein
MTINVKVSVNGNYKCPVTCKQGDREETQIISGRGHDGPKEISFPFYHGPDVMTLSVGPEEEDKGEDSAA